MYEIITTNVVVPCARLFFSLKIFRIMKLTALLMLLALLQVKASVYSQITLKEKNASIEKIMKEIERQTDYVFFYKSTLKNRDLNIDLKNVSISTALDVCYKGLP